MADMFSLYKNCTLCPRSCKIDRTKQKGYCGESSDLRIDSALLHFGEEPPITFKKGSGTIFFNGCSLRCVYCQNMQISQSTIHEKKYSLEEFVNMMETLIDKGAENINFVTPDHFLPHIVDGIKKLKSKGRKIPFVYNCSGYETLEHLEIINDYIDIYLFDYKYSEMETAKLYSNAPDYPDAALNALKYIYKNKGNLILTENGKAEKGVLVRHLILPNNVKNSIDAIDNLFFNFGNKVFLSLMSQYSPRYLKNGFHNISRNINSEEYNAVTEHLINLGFENCFVQEMMEAEDRYVPDFNEKKLNGQW